MFRTFKGKIMFFTLTLLLIFNLGLLNIVNNILFDNFKENIKGDMINIKDVTINGFRYKGNDSDSLEVNAKGNELQNIYSGVRGYVAFYDSLGRVLDYKGEKSNTDIINKLINESLNFKSMLNYNYNENFIATFIYPIYENGIFKFNFIVQEDYNQKYEELNNTISKIRSVQIVLFIVVALLLNSLIDRIVEPLKRLKDEMRMYGKGKYIEDLVVTSKDEVGEVTQSFNQMKKEKDELQIASREFFNNATHELKTPITSIYAYLQILKDNDIESIDKEFRDRALDRMSLECIKLKELIQKILDVSRGSIENRKEKEIVRINELVEDISNSLYIRCQRGSKEINVSLEPIEIEIVKVDIEQIILNLLDNAVKYSSSTNIDVTLKSYNDIKNTMVLEVFNKTRHIPEEIRLNLLEPFVKYDNGNGRNKDEISSSGLGLYLCLKLAEANGCEFIYSVGEDNITFTLLLK